MNLDFSRNNGMWVRDYKIAGSSDTYQRRAMHLIDDVLWATPPVLDGYWISPEPYFIQDECPCP